MNATPHAAALTRAMQLESAMRQLVAMAEGLMEALERTGIDMTAFEIEYVQIDRCKRLVCQRENEHEYQRAD